MLRLSSSQNLWRHISAAHKSGSLQQSRFNLSLLPPSRSYNTMTDENLVIREVTKNVWTFSGPFARFGVVPIGGRSTAVKLNNGDVWVLASTPFGSRTKATLDGMGKVRYIIGADSVHHLYLGDFKAAYPDAKLVAPEAAIERHGDTNLKFDGVWGRDPPDTKYGFEDEIAHCYFSGFKNKDVAFLHRASGTLIQADLLFNLPAKEQYSNEKYPPRLSGISVGPGSWLHKKFAWASGEDKNAMKRDVATVASWEFERIIPCHGDVIETGGKKAWLDAYADYVDK